MLTKTQKSKLVEEIYKLIKESVFENGFDENYYYEKDDEEPKDDDWDDEEDDEDNWDGEETEEEKEKRKLVVKWLDTAQELHSVLAYKLYPYLAAKGDVGKGTARSKFSQKYRNYEDKNFSPKEINMLYNLRQDFIQKGSLDIE